MNLGNTKELEIPEGPVKEIIVDDTVIWLRSDGRPRQLFNAATVPDENSYINPRNGYLGFPSSTGGIWRHSDYIEIDENLEYYIGMINAETVYVGLAWYDTRKRYISGVNATEIGLAGNIVTSPARSKWIRFSFRVDEGYNTNWETSVWLCENGVIDRWTPYEGGAE